MARKQRRKVGAARYEQQHASRDSNGSNRSEALDFGKVKGGVEFFKAEAKTMKFNVIPYEIKSKLHPEVARKKMAVGDLDYVMDIWIHQFIGPNNTDALCPKKNYGKPCPLCEEVSRLYDAKKDKDAKDLSASRRCFYNIQLVGKDGPESDTKVFHVSHYLFTKELMEEANECGKGDTIVPFADLEDGSIIKVRGTEEALGENKMLKFKSFDFLARDEEVPDELVDNAVSFDDLLILLTPEQIEAAMYGTDDEDDGEGEEVESQTEDEETPDDPPRRQRQRKDPEEKENGCPKGFAFGEDCDAKPACASCPDAIYDKCSSKAGL